MHKRISLFLVSLLVASLFASQPLLANDATTTPAPAAAGRFDIFEFVVDGNTVLPTGAIEKAVYPHLGPQRRIEDVEKAREALEKTYHDAGYLTVLVDIPEQKVNEGVVTLRVAEGSVERLRVSGSRYFSLGDIRAGTPALAVGSVPQFTEVQQELAQLSRSPDRRITPLLRAGKLPGKVEVELQVEDQLPLHGSLELNTKQSQDTKRGRLEGSLRYDNLWQRQHSLALNYITAPADRSQVEVVIANYTLPVDRQSGATLALYAVRSNSNVPTVLGSSVVGKGTTLGARYVLPLPGGGDWFHTLSAGLDYKDFKEDSLLDGSSRPIRYFPAALQYNATVPDSDGQWQFGAGVTLGLRGLADKTIDCDGVQKDQFECKRAGARANFAIFRADLTRQQNLGAGWSLLAHGDVQLTAQPLISNEQLAAGGVDSVRGYYDAERTGDIGLRGRLEIQTPSFGGDAMQINALAFVDYAELSLKEALPGQKDRFTLAGSGLGLKLKAGRHWNAHVYAARALEDGDQTKKGDLRIDARLAYEF
jgi:hemolysin activation/secretion protein